MLTVVWGAFTEATLWPNQETKEYPVAGIASIDASLPYEKVPDPVTVPPFPAETSRE